MQELAKVGDLMFPPMQHTTAATNQHQVQSCSVADVQAADQHQPRSTLQPENEAVSLPAAGAAGQHNNNSSEYPLPSDGWGEGCDYMDEIELSTGDVMARKGFGLNGVVDVASVLPIWKGYDRWLFDLNITCTFIIYSL